MGAVTGFLNRFLFRLIVVLILSGLGVTSVWQLIWPDASAAPESRSVLTTEVSRAGRVMLVFDQAVRSVRDYARTGDRREREEFEQHLRRLGEMISALDMAQNADDRRLAGALRDHAVKTEALATAVLAIADSQAGADGTAGAKLQQLSDVREQALLTVSELRELDAKKAEKDGSGSMNGLVTGGFVTLGVSLAGAVGLARFTVV